VGWFREQQAILKGHLSWLLRTTKVFLGLVVVRNIIIERYVPKDKLSFLDFGAEN
jgi:hypothetical protein